MNNSVTYYTLLLDKSGSMASCLEETIDGVNQQILRIREIAEKYPEQELITSLSIFNESVTPVWSLQRPDALREVTFTDYRPGGLTALLDAIGLTIESIRESVGPELENSEASAVVVIISDGYDNASSNFNQSQIASLIDELEASEKWTFSYIGLAMDSREIARKLNIREENILYFDISETSLMFSRVSELMDQHSQKNNPRRQVLAPWQHTFTPSKKSPHMLSINMKTQLLDSIERLFEISRNSQLEPGIFKQCSKDIKTVSSYFKTNRLQSILLAVIFVNNCQSESVGLETLGTHLGISPLRLLQESDDIEALTKSGIIRKTERTRSGRKNLLRQYFEFNDTVIEAMMDNRPMPDMAPQKPQDAIDLLRSLNVLWGRCERGELRPEELQRGMTGLLQENEKFPLTKAIQDQNMEDLEKFLFMMIIWKTLNSDQTTEVQKLIAPILRSSARTIRYMQNLNLSENDLIRKDLAEIVEADFFNDTSLRLTDRAVRIIRECGINLYRDAKKSENIIVPESIAEISLVFNSVERERIQMLKSILNEEKLTETRERLARKKQPMGIAILLYGPPGTGKTEAVYQLARETGRDIFKVDISSTKSMWFGESEKIIKKKLFTDYYAYAKKCERLPILFINEADAVISKRKQVGASNVAQTENAIQNIILEELEKFDGILFCTTNLADNLDPAFERRFLFKIELGAPDIKSRKEIWSLKLPGLTSEDLGTLSARFHFSGGQINNIVRKADMYEIINGVDPDLAAIIGFCEEESTGWHESRQSLGFRLPEAS